MSDLVGWDFPIDVSRETGKIKTILNDDSIRNGINIILGTSNFERKGLPEFGTNIKSFVFQNVDPSLLGQIEENIKDALKKWEKYIKNLEVNVVPDSNHNEKIIVNISYETNLNQNVQTISKVLNVNNLQNDIVKRKEFL